MRFFNKELKTQRDLLLAAQERKRECEQLLEESTRRAESTAKKQSWKDRFEKPRFALFGTDENNGPTDYSAHVPMYKEMLSKIDKTIAEINQTIESLPESAPEAVLRRENEIPDGVRIRLQDRPYRISGDGWLYLFDGRCYRDDQKIRVQAERAPMVDPLEAARNASV